MLAGGTAGVAMWSVAIPPDVSRGVPEKMPMAAAQLVISNRTKRLTM